MPPIGLYLESQLTRYESTFFRVPKDIYWMLDPNKNMTQLIPDLPIGFQQIKNYQINHFGSAGIYDSASTDIPLVEFNLEGGNVVKSLIFINGARWNEFDLIQEQVSNQLGTMIPSFSIISEKNAAMGEYLNRREHYSLLYGIVNRGFYGLLTQPNVTLDDTSTAIPNFYNLTNEEIYDQFLIWISDFITQAQLSTASQIYIKIPEKLKYNMALPYNSSGPTTLWEMLTDSSKAYFVGKIDSAKELEGSNLLANGVLAGSTKDMLIFTTLNNPDGLKAHYYPRNQTPVMKTSSLVYETVSYSGMTGIYLRNSDLLTYALIDNTPA